MSKILTLTHAELLALWEVLDFAGEQFSIAGCEDTQLPMVPGMEEFLTAVAANDSWGKLPSFHVAHRTVQGSTVVWYLRNRIAKALEEK
ncbi:MAG: hypothetical protein M0R22_00340 [Dehalococcoidia bacterium]|nr:hypothetical protein [Dehalococcoidia bacterium]